MALIEKNCCSDLKEFDHKNYFFRVANIYLENNEKTKYVKYLNTLNVISKKIQNFYENKLSMVYSEYHNGGIIVSNIEEKLLIEINNLNNTIIHMLMIFQIDNYESVKFNSSIEKELIKIYDIINHYDFDYYMNKAFDEWFKISIISDEYLTINIKLFNDEDDDFNPITKLLTFFSKKSDK